MLAPLTLLGQIPRGYDTDAFYAPFGAFLHNQLALGNLPLWNPHAFAGQPFAADPQSGALYPPALIAYGFLDAPHALVALTTFHYLIAVLGRLRDGAAGRREPARLDLRRPRLRRLGAAVRARAGARPALGRRLDPRLHRGIAARRPPPRAHRAGGRAAGGLAMSFLALTGSQQITAVTGVACILVLVVERGVARRHRRTVAGAGAVALSAVALLPASSSCGSRSRPTASSIPPASGTSCSPTCARCSGRSAPGSRRSRRSTPERSPLRCADRARPPGRGPARADRARDVRPRLGVGPRRVLPEPDPADPRHRGTRAGSRAPARRARDRGARGPLRRARSQRLPSVKLVAGPHARCSR